MTTEEAINSLIMYKELMLLDPITGETHELREENRNNQDLYNACTIAILSLLEKIKHEKGCSYCNSENIIPCKIVTIIY